MPIPNFGRKLGKFLVRTAENDEETSGSPRFKATVAEAQENPEDATKIYANAAKDRATETAAALAIPLSGGVAGPIVADATNLVFAADGLYNLVSGNGVQKTYKLARQKDGTGAARSAVGDALNLSAVIPAFKLLGKTKGLLTIPQKTQIVHHRSPVKFNVDKFHTGTANDIGLHSGDPTEALGKFNYRLEIPQTNIKTLDLHDNDGRHLLKDYVFEGRKTPGFYDTNPADKMLFLKEYIRNPKNGGKKFPTFKPGENGSYIRIQPNDFHFNARRRLTKNLSGSDRRSFDKEADAILERTKGLERNGMGEYIDDATKKAATAINKDAAALLHKYGIDVVEYPNHNTFEGIRSSFFITDPTVIKSGKLENSSPLSVAEKLGIPKGERFNPQALEDPYYWGYQQGNQRYNQAVQSGNLEEAQRLRDLHFNSYAKNNVIVDDLGMPKKVYHGSPEEFNVFDYTKSAKYPDGHFFFGEDFNYVKSHVKRRTSENPNIKSYYLYDTEKYPINKNKIDKRIVPHIIDKNGFPLKNELSSDMASYIMTHFQDKPHIIYGYDVGREVMSGKYDYAVPFNTQIKLTNPITYDNGKIIPIVKRDNFHNPDIRYKQGGNIK